MSEILLPQSPLPDKPSTWEATKAWFKYSETILLARLTVLSGFIAAVISATNFGPLLGVDFENKKAIFVTGSIAIVQGLAMEILRRRGDPNLGNK